METTVVRVLVLIHATRRISDGYCYSEASYDIYDGKNHRKPLRFRTKRGRKPENEERTVDAANAMLLNVRINAVLNGLKITEMINEDNDIKYNTSSYDKWLYIMTTNLKEGKLETIEKFLDGTLDDPYPEERDEKEWIKMTGDYLGWGDLEKYKKGW